jgi:tRNA-specific 2-thiouridylase
VLERHLGHGAAALSAGPIITVDGREVGRHDGFARYTIGQRKGLPGGSALPMYVVAIRPTDRAVVIGPREALLGRGVVARGVNWLVDEPPSIGAHVTVQVRHRAQAAAAELIRHEGDEVELALDQPVAAITPGQSLVIYDGPRVLGGGIIDRAQGTRATLPVLAA